MADLTDPLEIRLKPKQNPVAQDFLKLAAAIVGGAAVILTPILLMNTRFFVRNAIFLALCFGAAHAFKDFLFGTYVNARSGAKTLVLTKYGFLDTRMLEQAIAWSDISSIERNSSHFSPDGLLIGLGKPCAFTEGFLDPVIAKLLFRKFDDKQRVFVSFSGLDFDGDELAGIFAAKSGKSVKSIETGGGYGRL